MPTMNHSVLGNNCHTRTLYTGVDLATQGNTNIVGVNG